MSRRSMIIVVGLGVVGLMIVISAAVQIVIAPIRAPAAPALAPAPLPAGQGVAPAAVALTARIKPEIFRRPLTGTSNCNLACWLMNRSK